MKTVFVFQFILAATAITFFASGFSKFIKRERSQTVFKFFANSLVWLGIALFALFPGMTHSVSQKLGFGESLNTFIFIGFVFTFIVLFKIINIIERIERNISEIVRKEALNQIKQPQQHD